MLKISLFLSIKDVGNVNMSWCNGGRGQKNSISTPNSRFAVGIFFFNIHLIKWLETNFMSFPDIAACHLPQKKGSKPSIPWKYLMNLVKFKRRVILIQQVFMLFKIYRSFWSHHFIFYMIPLMELYCKKQYARRVFFL